MEVGNMQIDQLRAEMQKIMAEDQVDLQQVGKSLVANSGDVAKFDAAVNYVRADPTVTGQNLDKAVLGLENFNTAESVAVRQSLQDARSTLPYTFENLERMRVEARETVFGERFNEFVSVVKRRLERITNVVAELAQKPDMSQQDLMRIQYEVMQMSIVLDVASKVGDKGSQALQTLFRDK